MAAMGVSVCGIMMMMIMGAAAQAPAPSVDCQTAVFTLTDCVSFVTGTDKAPSAACCSELSSIVSSSPQCLCLLFNTTFTEPLGINITLAQQLPPLCKVQTPPTSLCTLLGVPVPGPVSSGMAPTPAASAMTPTQAPTAAPMAPTSISSSPSPSSAPASSPSPMSPLASSPSPTTAPTGSIVPSGSTPTTSTTTVAPAPNRAPSITAKNAAVASCLLFFASIFLS